MKLVTIIGARPQFIKAAILSMKIQTSFSENIQEILVHTGQHYDENMSDIFFEEMKIPKPKYQLNIGSRSHGVQTGKMLMGIEAVLVKEKPDLVIVYGDTNSTAAGCLAASKLHIPIAHIEAGLRSNNMAMPEEQNRIIADHLANFLFCPTKTAIVNLRKEGLIHLMKKKSKHNLPIVVENVGDIMYEAILYYKNMAQSHSNILEKNGLSPGNYCLATIHRAENTDEPTSLRNIFEAFKQLKETIIIAVHPRTKKFISEYHIQVPENIHIIDPVGYLDMIQLESKAKIIFTDSGGVQKEAYFLRIPCITLRNETEWTETQQDDWNKVVGNETQKILSAYSYILGINYNKKKQTSFFGRGDTSEKIIKTLMKYARN